MISSQEVHFNEFGHILSKAKIAAFQKYLSKEIAVCVGAFHSMVSWNLELIKAIKTLQISGSRIE